MALHSLARWAALALLGWALAAGALELSPQELRGKQIYLDGQGASGQPIKAFVGKESTEMPGSIVPCASCHGRDGLGRPEGGVLPAVITWSYLTKPYGHVHENGRKHPAFDERSVGRAILDGVDPAGHRLDPAMPRYAMAEQDLADLIAYLERLEADKDPGLTDTALTLGTLVPLGSTVRAGDPLTELGQAMRAVLQAYFDEINAQGGIYNRKLTLKVAESAFTSETGAQSAVAAARRLIEQDRVFALVGAFTAGADQPLAALVEDEHVPLIGPFTLFPQDSLSLNRYTFYLLSGLAEQARVLVDYAAQGFSSKSPSVAVVHPAGQELKDIIAAIDAQGGKHGWSAAAEVAYPRDPFDPARLASELVERAADAVFFFGPPRDLVAMLAEVRSSQWSPRIFLSGSLSDPGLFALPARFADKVFLAYPTLPSDHTPAGIQELNALRQKYHLPDRHLIAQVSVYCAAKVLVEGLKLAGKDLSREKLLSTLEALYQFDTGLTPRVTYGPNRRIGALGAYVVTVDLEKRDFRPVSRWLTPQ
jgi:ABC-type branched-subunit amino acid transport system substrate-binding protein